MEKEILEQPKVLASLKGTNEVTIKNLVSDIKQRDIKMVYFAARGTSDHASIYASYLISTYVGIPTGLALPSVVTAYNGKLCLKDALVIILQNPVHTGPKLLHHIYIMEDSHDFSVSWSANSCKEHLP